MFKTLKLNRETLRLLDAQTPLAFIQGGGVAPPSPTTPSCASTCIVTPKGCVSDHTACKCKLEV